MGARPFRGCPARTSARLLFRLEHRPASDSRLGSVRTARDGARHAKESNSQLWWVTRRKRGTCPAKHAHYAWTGNEEGILQVQFVGPGGIDYVNPADDPRLGYRSGDMPDRAELETTRWQAGVFRSFVKAAIKGRAAA